MLRRMRHLAGLFRADAAEAGLLGLRGAGQPGHGRVAFVVGQALFFGLDGERGGPAGELVMWSDMVQGAMLLGYDTAVAHDARSFTAALGASPADLSPGAGERISAALASFDVIVTDYVGISELRKRNADVLGPRLRGRLLVADIFGTEAWANALPAARAATRGLNPMYCCLQLESPAQYLSLWPRPAENTYIGVVIPPPRRPSQWPMERAARGLIWGKDARYFKGKRRYLEAIHDGGRVTLDATAAQAADLQQLVPFVHNVGVLHQHEFTNLMWSSRLFIGLGDPLDGPSPMEALAHGLVYIQPLTRPAPPARDDPRLRGKPITRGYETQAPYAAEIGPPLVYSVDERDTEGIRKIVRDVMSRPSASLQSFIPKYLQVPAHMRRVDGAIQATMRRAPR